MLDEWRAEAAWASKCLARCAKSVGRDLGRQLFASAPTPVRQDATGQAGSRPLVLIITGAPASGKTTVGRQLAAALGLPYFPLPGSSPATVAVPAPGSFSCPLPFVPAALASKPDAPPPGHNDYPTR